MYQKIETVLLGCWIIFLVVVVIGYSGLIVVLLASTVWFALF